MTRRSHRGWRWPALLFLIALAGLLTAHALLQARPLDARKYGMVGDNTKDNSAALLRACRAGVAKRLPVVIPNGRYFLASPVYLPAGVKLRGGRRPPQRRNGARLPAVRGCAARCASTRTSLSAT